MATVGDHLHQSLRDIEMALDQFKVPFTRGLGLGTLVRDVWQQNRRDHMGAWAGDLTYRTILTIFPVLLFLLTLLGLFHLTGLVNWGMVQLANVLPAGAHHFVSKTLLSLADQHASNALTLGAIVTMAFALWAISSTMRVVMSAMNVMYGIHETRAWWRRYALSVIFSVVVLALFSGALLLIFLGQHVEHALAPRSTVSFPVRVLWQVLRGPVLLALAFAGFALVYRVAPAIQLDWRYVLPGAFVSLVAWLVFSLVFSHYVVAFATFHNTYGWLAGFFIFVLYAYYSSYILLFGAQINQVMHRHASIQGGRHRLRLVHSRRRQSG